MEQLQDTAYYIFDYGILAQRLAHLRSLLGEKPALAYAIKANPFLVQGTLGNVERLEICSPGESEICDALGVDPKITVISGINKTPAFIEKLVAQTDGRIYTVESLTQFDLLNRLSRKYHKKLTILLRLTNDSQFGINRQEIEELIKNRERYKGLEFRGIQFFSGTQKTSLKKLRREILQLEPQDAGNHKARQILLHHGVERLFFNGAGVEAFQAAALFIKEAAGPLHPGNGVHFPLDFFQLDAVAHVLDLEVFPAGEDQLALFIEPPQVAGAVDALRVVGI